jgi:hypothetical protein
MADAATTGLVFPPQSAPAAAAALDSPAAPANPAQTPAPLSNRSNILSTLQRLFEEAIELKVVTAVGPVKVTLSHSTAGSATKTEVDNGPDPLESAIVTIFNMLDGDVTNVISSSLKDDQAIRDFHAAQVEKSLTVIPQNMKALFDFGTALIKEL